ncbi:MULTISPECIES: hypothetical protein [Acidithiobacillus]|jgi:hypothetical protein|uniref:Uncharacterized protein n=1 Tax=Acidithiobacillus thiooxidans ATCC 19377 TaxID=637390 RepID=A0A5P9XQ67_ACITH|nr:MULTISPECIES: hypothetical protein [Acidithiobacillus]MBU2743254.1 hypothetical protein [Acidithiobacillus albertensis]MBU2835384.1 hypothetical protein [Acidithiobacillus thiooxidans]QFX95513.1 hypothetical protein GCD22_01104 [Acidithiobacillus thiooxidans ATCC 19377]
MATTIRKLKDVRVLAEGMRKTQADGHNPGKLLSVNASMETVSMTFEQCAQDLLEAKRSGWKNAKHAQQ